MENNEVTTASAKSYGESVIIVGCGEDHQIKELDLIFIRKGDDSLIGKDLSKLNFISSLQFIFIGSKRFETFNFIDIESARQIFIVLDYVEYI